MKRFGKQQTGERIPFVCVAVRSQLFCVRRSSAPIGPRRFRASDRSI